MGVEVIWIGVESSKATYGKLKGIDVKAIFESLHSHGINTLASLILGHDFHTVESVWEDLDYLVSLKPSLSQILILTPGCGTPLFDRFTQDKRLLDTAPHKHWDGFHLVFDHPHISKEKMEQLILDVYDEEYRRLGPSAIRFMEKKLNGYLKFKNAKDPLLRKRAEQFKRGCLEALPIFPTARRYAPSKEVALYIENTRQAIVRETGSGGLKTKILSSIVPALAFVENFKQAHYAYPQAKLKRTRYKLSTSLLQPLPVTGNGLLTIKPIIPNTADKPLVVDLHGDLTMETAKKLIQRIMAILKERLGHLAINFRGITSIDDNALLLFVKKLRAMSERIKIVNIDTVRADIADNITYAKKYFEVYTTIEGMNVGPA
jgi:anti-anti-sigma regulatory factor